MTEEPIVPGQPLGEILLDQINTLLAMASRSVVQRQILVVGLILVVAWLLPESIRRWMERRETEPATGEHQAGWRIWTGCLYRLYGPLVSLILTNIMIWFFEQQGNPHGMLENVRLVFWIWLGYRALLIVLYARYGDELKPFHRWLLRPVFAILVLLPMASNLFGLGFLADIPVFRLSDVTVTLSRFVIALILLYFFLAGAWIVERFMDRSLPSRIDAEPGVIQSVATLIRYAISAVGILLSLAVVGFNVTTLALVAGGLSVGIGIGLQDIVSNFVSGLLLLFEQSLRPGDVIELDGQVVEVQRISMRATTVSTLDNVEVVIPNATFTNSQVTTLTKTERLVRVLVPFGVSYDSDPEEVRAIAEKVSLEHSLVLGQPPPALLFSGYGESSLDFKLAVWFNQPEQRQRLKSDLYYLLWSALADRGIEVPFPQRDLNIGSGWEELVEKQKGS